MIDVTANFEPLWQLTIKNLKYDNHSDLKVFDNHSDLKIYDNHNLPDNKESDTGVQ